MSDTLGWILALWFAFNLGFTAGAFWRARCCDEGIAR